MRLSDIAHQDMFPNIVRWLAKHGDADPDIAKVVGGNAMRVRAEVWCQNEAAARRP